VCSHVWCGQVCCLGRQQALHQGVAWCGHAHAVTDARVFGSGSCDWRLRLGVARVWGVCCIEQQCPHPPEQVTGGRGAGVSHQLALASNPRARVRGADAHHSASIHVFRGRWRTTTSRNVIPVTLALPAPLWLRLPIVTPGTIPRSSASPAVLLVSAPSHGPVAPLFDIHSAMIHRARPARAQATPAIAIQAGKMAAVHAAPKARRSHTPHTAAPECVCCAC
jgi:hypothetical protein